ncbi:hypothetical protein [Amycolatopsis sp. NPDC051061]|uniref:hypothetical protein n=1 Tax=Amycolatopsis sp. NPDC051061 TaxID=3155042 RepID=UPI003417EF7D
MSETRSRSTANSPLTLLQQQFAQPHCVARFDRALLAWSAEDSALSEVACHEDLVMVLSTRDYNRHDDVLHALLTRAAASGTSGITAAEMVVNAMLPVVPGIVGRIVRAARTAAGSIGARRGVTGGGVSAAEDSRDIQVSVLGHLWEQSCCYPLRRRHHVAANLMRETQRAAQRDFGIDHSQAAAEVISMDDDVTHRPPAAAPVEPDASEELLTLLAWAVENERLDEHAATILTARYFGDPIGRDGVTTDRQIGTLIGLSQPTITRHRRRALEQLTKAAPEFPGCMSRWAS